MGVDPNQLNSLALAYIGDAVYELYIRNYLIQVGQVKPQRLHNEAVTFVSGTAQATIIHDLLHEKKLTDKEEAIVRRGRNAKSQSIPKNMSISTYRYATAFEALIGYHYINNNINRLDELMDESIRIILNESRV